MELLLTTTGTQSPVIINDLGNRSFTHPTTNYNLLNDYSIITLMNSFDLRGAVTSGYITLATENANAVSDPRYAPWHNAEEIVSIPVDDSTRDADHLLYYNAVSGKIEYVSPGELVTGRAIYSLGFYTSSSPYIEYSSTNWQVVAQFPYLGSTTVQARSLYVVGSRNGTNGLAEARLWDPVAGLELSYLSWASADLVIYVDTTLVNIPASPAVIELQVKKDGSTASKVRMHSMVLY